MLKASLLSFKPVQEIGRKKMPKPNACAPKTGKAEDSSSAGIAFKYLKPVLLQNTVNLVNGIFLIVSVLLLFFGELHESLFLASVLLLNIAIGIVQDLRAKIALEKLQILTAPKIVRISNNKEECILLNKIGKNDILKIDLGDQIAADGVLTESNGLEVNEAFITGESHYIHKKEGDSVLAGSIAMAGSAKMRATSLPKDSYIVRMTEKIKIYNSNPSPIQAALNKFIKYMTYLLLVIIVYVIAHGLKVNVLFVSIVRDIGALTGTLIPQGLILSTTALFAYGALRLSKDNMLMQEINATEKLARIKNLCLDKTGTLTSQKPAVEEIIPYDNNKTLLIKEIAAGYIAANHDTSEVANAIKEKIDYDFLGQVADSLPFSSVRRYGIATIKTAGGKDNDKETIAVVGAPDVLMVHIAEKQDRRWVEEKINLYAPKAKRLVLMAKASQHPGRDSLEGIFLTPLAMFVLSDPLREGIQEIIDFLQKQNVRIRVISGDDPKTVRAIADRAGLKYTDMIITGQEMESWDDVEYEERVPAYHLFARINPTQKEKIISVLKKSGFTAMVGDGANDALAIKKADLGIAMFDAVRATRQIAQIILTKNSFDALPKGINLAGSIVTNIELIASIFFNKIVAALVLFMALAFLGYSYPLSPSSTTLINCFTVWIPVAYFTMFPASRKGIDTKQLFAGKALLFSAINGVLMALAAVSAFLLEPQEMYSDSNVLVVITLIALGYWFFVLAPLNYGVAPTRKEEKKLGLIFFLTTVFLVIAFNVGFLSTFFELQKPALIPLLLTFVVISAAGFLQYAIAVHWFSKRRV